MTSRTVRQLFAVVMLTVVTTCLGCVGAGHGTKAGTASGSFSGEVSGAGTAAGVVTEHDGRHKH